MAQIKLIIGPRLKAESLGVNIICTNGRSPSLASLLERSLLNYPLKREKTKASLCRTTLFCPLANIELNIPL